MQLRSVASAPVRIASVLPRVDPVAHHLEAVPAARLGLGELGSAVGRSVIDQDDFAGQSELLEGRPQLGDEVRNVRRLR